MFFFLLLPFSKSIFFPIIVVCTSKSTPSCITTCVAVVGIVLSCHLIGDKFSMKSSIIFCLSTPIFSIYFFNFGSFHAPKKNIGNSSYYDYPFFCFFLASLLLWFFLCSFFLPLPQRFFGCCGCGCYRRRGKDFFCCGRRRM